MENIVSTLAGRSLADRHEAYAAEIRTLLDAALTVMRRDETIEPRVSDIVRTAGLSNQAFYRHFRGKDELLVALLDDGRQRLLATIERRMARADGTTEQVRAWIEAVLAQARDPEAAAATRPFALNGDRLAMQFPGETQGSRDRLIEPLGDLVGEAAALAIYHVAMGTVHDALVERRTPARAEVDAVVEFALKERALERELLVTGIGGQGVQLAAQVLARGATLEGSYVMLFGVYAGAMRGMNTDATVVIGDEPLLSPPLVSHAWSAIGMHDKFWTPVARKLREGALVLVNDATFETELDESRYRVLRVPATDVADELGNPLGGSMVMAGAYAATSGLVGLDALLEGMRASIPPYRTQHIAANETAIRTGHAWGAAA